MPRQPSSQPPCGTASMCEPTTTILSDSPCDRRPQVPGDVALDRRVGLGELAEQPLARRRASPRSTRAGAPRPGPPVSSASSCRSLSGRSQSKSGMRGTIGATPERVRGSWLRMIRWGASSGSPLPFSACSLRARRRARRSSAASATLVRAATRTLREAVFEGQVRGVPQGAEDADALHAAGARRRTRRRGARSTRPASATWITAPSNVGKYTYDKTVQDLLAPGELPRGRGLPLARRRAGRTIRTERAISPRLQAARRAAGPRRCATCASRTAATSRVVFNRGREAAGPFAVDFLRDGVSVGTVEVTGLAPQAPITVMTSSARRPACAAGHDDRGGRRRRARRSTRPTRRTTPSASSVEALYARLQWEEP